MASHWQTDKFTPCRLDADAPDNLEAIFARARRIAAGEDAELNPGERRVVIVTPGRAFVTIPPVPQNLMRAETLAGLNKWLGHASRNIAVIGYTSLPGLTDQDQGKLKCIPFLPQLMMMTAAGHNIVVFEGHPAALGIGLRDADGLIVDSGMLPFLQPDWMVVATRVMRPAATYFIYGREKKNLAEIIPAPQAPGWRWKIVDGEASYAFCLLSVLGKESGRAAKLSTGKPVPDLSRLTSDAAELEWIATFPFDYERLSAAAVIGAILKMAGVNDNGPRLIPGIKSHYSLNARLAQDGGSSFCPFRVTLSGFGSQRHLEIVRDNF